MKKGFLLSLFFIVLASILGVFLGYTYADLKKEKAKVTSFYDLPMRIQEQYIKKEDVPKFKSFLSVKEKDIIPADEPIIGDDEELKIQIKELRQTNQMLYRENIELADKEWELALKLQESQNAVASEKERLRARNLENINEAEKQHYKNVNDLTKRINELQQEAIESTQSYETQIINLENELEELKHSLQEKEFEVSEEINAATKKERLSNSSLAEKNRHLLEQIQLMKEKTDAILEENSKKLKVAKEDILSLKRQLSQKDTKTNILLTKHTKEILELEQKNATNLRQLRENMSNLQKKHKEEMAEKNSEIAFLMQSKKDEITTLKSTYEQDGSHIQGVLIAAQKDQKVSLETIASLQRKNDNLQKRNETLSAKLQNIEAKMRDVVSKKDQEYATTLQEIKNKTLRSKSEDSEVIAKLERQILEDVDNIESLKSTNVTLVKQIDELKEQARRGINQKEFEKNEEKHAQNYKILNSKIIDLKKQRDKFISKAQEEIGELKKRLGAKGEEKEDKKTKFYIASLEEKIAKYEKTKSVAGTNDKQEEIDALKKALKQKDSEFVALRDDLTDLKEIQEDSRLYQAQLVKRQKQISVLKNELKTLKRIQADRDIESRIKVDEGAQTKKSLEQSLAKIASLEDDVSMLSREKEALEKQNEKLKADKSEVLKSRLVLASETMETKEKEIEQLEYKLHVLEEQNKKIENEKRELEAENTKKTEKQLQDMASSLQKSQNEVMSLKGDVAVLEKRNKELLAANSSSVQNKSEHSNISQDELDTLKNDLRNRKAEVLALKGEFDTLVKTNIKLKDEIKKLHENSSASQNNPRLASMEEELKTLENENIQLISDLEKAKKSTSSSIVATRKKVLKQSIICDDMPKGSNTPTSSCETRVKKILKDFNKGYFFEIVPIVDNGGFASLNKVQKSRLDIPKSEIERLTRLSNIGIGKDRAASGGKLVEKILGDNVLISYALENKDIPKKRGFVINVYE